MADGLLPINFVVNEKYLAFSEVDPKKILLPNFFQEDVVQIRFKALKRVSSIFPFLEKLTLSGYALQISIGSAGSIMANANAWTEVENATAIEGELSLNTAAIVTALGANAEVALTFEILLSTGSVKHRMTQQIIVKKSVITAGALVPIAGDTALGSLEAERKYCKRKGLTDFTMVDAVTGKEMLIYLNNGTLVAEDIS